MPIKQFLPQRRQICSLIDCCEHVKKLLWKDNGTLVCHIMWKVLASNKPVWAHAVTCSFNVSILLLRPCRRQGGGAIALPSISVHVPISTLVPGYLFTCWYLCYVLCFYLVLSRGVYISERECTRIISNGIHSFQIHSLGSIQHIQNSFFPSNYGYYYG